MIAGARLILLQAIVSLVLVSAGFDCHYRDPLGGMEVTERGFVTMAKSLLRVASESASGRLAAVLEGGYDLDAIRHSSEAVLLQLCRGAAPAGERLDSGSAFAALKDVLRPHWQL